MPQLVNGTTAYWFRIQRTAASVTTVPKADTSTLLIQDSIMGGYSALPNTGAGGGGGTQGGEGASDASGGDGGSGLCELWYE